MGLDFNGSNAYWGYIGFHNFRKRLAAALGFDLDQMEGFGGRRPWSEIKHPLKPFLNHSDCEGSLSAAECKRIGPALLEVVRNWPEEDRDRIQAEMLANDMIRLAKRGKTLEFC